MRNDFLLLLPILTVMCIIKPSVLIAYDDETTHRKININAVEQASINDTLIEQLGFSDGIEEIINGKEAKWWIQEGGKKEDALSRPLNHFHDPLVDEDPEKTWEDAGLWLGGKSMLVWAIDLDYDSWTNDNKFSWWAARKYFYNALVGYDAYGGDIPHCNSVEDYYAQMFRSLGQLMHLVSDAAVPSHARNDSHPGGFGTWAKDLYEKWASTYYEYEDKISYKAKDIDASIFNQADLTQTPPYLNTPITALWDQNIYDGTNPEVTWSNDLGLTEFTNANFISQNTMYGQYNYPDIHSVSNPILVMAEDGKSDHVNYILHPDEGYKLAALSYVAIYGVVVPQYLPVIDDNVCQDYAAELIPMAVGYSEALLKYFFRGDFDVSRASFLRNAAGELSGVDMMVKNASKLSESSTDIELFSNGIISLVSKYIPPGDDEYEYSLIENAYTVYGTNDLINSEYRPINKNFVEPIPLGATDISLTLVFRGKMGNETGAVAARVLKINSRIAYSYQDGGGGNESHIYTMLPDGTDERQITSDVEPNTYFFNPEWSPDGRLLAFTKEICTDPDPEPDGFCDPDYYEREIWVIDPFSSEPYPGNVLSMLNGTDTDSPWADELEGFSFSPDGSWIVALTHVFNTVMGLVIFDVSDGNGMFINGPDYWVNKQLFYVPPAWSPQGDAIAFYMRNEGSEVAGNIYIISPNGGEETQLTNDTSFFNTHPAWSVDGEQIVFVSNRDGAGNMDIWIMDHTGGNKQKIFDCDSDCASPSVSPDGEKISFIMGGNIHTIGFDGNGMTPVTISGSVSSPSWSPLIIEVSDP